MGIFGSRKAYDPSTATVAPLSFGDRAAIFAAELFAPGTGQYLRQQKTVVPIQRAFGSNLAQLIAGTPDSVGQAAIPNSEGQDISAALAPQYEVQKGRAPLNINSPELPALAVRAQQIGFPISNLLDVLKAQQPDVRYDRGFGYNGKTGESMGAFHPNLGDGMALTPGGVVNLPGYVNSASETAQAVEGAKAKGTAPYQFQTLTGPDNRPRTITNETAAVLGSKGGIIAVGPSPADTIKAEGAARGDVERDQAALDRAAAAPKQLAALDEMEKLLPDVISGFGSDVRLNAARALALTGNPEATRKVRATETFINQGRVLVASIIKTFGSNPTEGERKFAERMSGADAELNPETLAEGIRLQRARIYRDLEDAGKASQPASSRPRSGSLSSVPLADRMAEARRRGLIP